MTRFRLTVEQARFVVAAATADGLLPESVVTAYVDALRSGNQRDRRLAVESNTTPASVTWRDLDQ
jgi:hypothetical protein